MTNTRRPIDIARSARIPVATSIGNFDIDGTLVEDCRRILELIAGHERPIAEAYWRHFDRLARRSTDSPEHEARMARWLSQLAARLRDVSDQAWADAARDDALASYERGAPILWTVAAGAAAQRAMTRAMLTHLQDDGETFERLCNAAHRLSLVEVDILTDAIHIVKAEEAREKSRQTAGLFRDRIGNEVDELSAQSGELRQLAADASAETRGMLGKAAEVSTAAEESAAAMAQAAHTSAGLIDAIEAARGEVAAASEVADRAAGQAGEATRAAEALADHVKSIESILSLIREIAGQTNLLALNATIEAAHAGDAGRGFAVVASEVKSLAGQTASATDDIAAKIAAIQSATRQTVATNNVVRDSVAEVQLTAARIRDAMDRQAHTVTVITAAVDETATAAAAMSSILASIRADTDAVAQEIDELEKGFSAASGRLAQLRRAAEDYADMPS